MSTRRRNDRMRRITKSIGRFSALAGFEPLEDRRLLSGSTSGGQGFSPLSSGDIDLALNSLTANNSTLTVNYTISNEDAGTPFRFGLYGSTDRVFDGDTLYSSVIISDPADLTVGTHTKSYTIGSDAGQLALPGAGVAETDSDYFILGVLDDLNDIDESETDPFNNNNTAALTGAYLGTDGALLVQGGAGNDTASFTTSTLTLNIAGAGTSTTSLTGVNQVRIRAHEGNDTISLASGFTPTVFALGADGDDTLNTSSANVTFDGGAGNNIANISGTTGDDAFAISPTGVTLGGRTVAVTNSATMISGLDGKDTFTVSGNGGNVSIDGGAGDDTVVFQDGASLGGSLIGGAGANTLDLSAVTSALNVSLPTSKVTGLGGTFSAFQTILGGSNVGNTLTGPSSNSSWVLSGTSTAVVGGVTVSGMRNFIGGAGNDTFNLSAYTGTGSITGGGGSDLVTLTKDADVTLSNSQLFATGGPNVSLSGVSQANLFGGAGNNVFTFTGWTGTGFILGGGGSDKLIFSKDAANFALADSQLAVSGGPTMSLSGIGQANLAGGASNNSFNIDNWSGIGSITGGGGSDKVLLTKNVNISVSDTRITAINGPTMNLSGVIQANITGGLSDNIFNLNGWTGIGSITGGGGNDKVLLTKDADVALSNTQIAATGGPTMSLSGVTQANLTGGASNNTFNLSGWTGIGSITGGGGTDAVTIASDTNFSLTDTRLTATNGTNILLSGVTQANLTGGASNNVFTLTGWTGTGSITGGGGTDTVALTKDADVTLTNSQIAATGGPTMGLSGIAQATLRDNATTTRTIDASAFSGSTTVYTQGTAGLTLKGGAGNDLFVLDGYTGTGSIVGGGGNDKLLLTQDADFTLSNTQLVVTGGPNLSLSGIIQANLTGGASSNTFDITGWTGYGSITGGGGNDTVVLTSDTNVSLSNTQLTATGGANMVLSGIAQANLTGGASNNVFTLTGWTGTGSITGGGGNDSVVLAKDVDITLTNSQITATGGPTMGLSGIAQATLRSNATSTRTIDASAFSGSVTFYSQGSAGLTLKGGSGNDMFMLDGYTGTGSLIGGGGSDKVVVTKDADFTLTNTQLVATGGPNLSLSGIVQANLTGGASGNLFNLSGWTGIGSITGGGGTDTVTLTRDTNFTLTNTQLTATGGANMILSGITQANLTGGASNNVFTLNGWTGTGSITGGGGSDKVVVTRDADFTLTNTQLSATGGPTMSLSGVAQANLIGGASNNNFTITGWTGYGSITGGGGSDKVTLSKDANFTLSDTQLAATGGPTMSLAGVTQADLTGGSANNTFDVSGWTGSGNLKAYTGYMSQNKLTVIKDADITLTVNSVTASDGLNLNLVGFYSASLTVNTTTTPRTIDASTFPLYTNMYAHGPAGLTLKGGPNTDIFNLDGYTGTGSIIGGGGSDKLLFTKDAANFTLGNTQLAVSGGPTLSLSGIGQANLTGGASDNSFNLDNWTGVGSITAGGGNNTIYLTNNSSISLSDTLISAGGGLGMNLSGINQAYLTGGASNNTFTITGWNGTGSIIGGGGTDTVLLVKNADMTLSDSQLTATDGPTMSLSGVTAAKLYGGALVNTFTLSGWTGTGTIKGSGNYANIKVVKDADMTLTFGNISASDGLNMVLNYINQATLEVDTTTTARTINVPNFTGNTTLIATGPAEARLLGGSGSNTIINGAGSGIIVGGPKNDTLTATGSGRILMIGGQNQDTMQGNGNTLMISGSTTYGTNVSALDQILAEWASASSYDDRINHILNGGGLNGTTRLTNTTVVTDTAVNLMSNPTANVGDWYVTNAIDSVTKKPEEKRTVFPQ